MSDEQSMTIIENLSEELGEKELKIMALEKELEEQKKQKLEYLELCEIKQYLIDFSKVAEDHHCRPIDIIGNGRDGTGIWEEDDELMKRTIVHFFGGRIMTKEEYLYDNWAVLNDFDQNWEYLIDANYSDIIDIEDGTYWVSDEL